ncbi:MAG TPA: amino acid ABC transporter permease [Dongiaceae bacterium]|nr:amino acid ABC transporter permease [Dongiaceae bacterium]
MTFNLGIIIAKGSPLVGAAGVTVLITLASLALGMLIGVVVCAMQRSGKSALVYPAVAYVAVFRTIPEMVLIFWIYFCMPAVTGLTLSGIASGCIALGLASGAYLAEIYRGGIEAVPLQQHEAGQALGLPTWLLWVKVILPQAVRFMVPPFMNYFTELLKNTTLVAAIGVAELAYAAYALGGQTFRYLEFMTAIGVIYFAIIFPIGRYAIVIERKLNPGQTFGHTR